MEPRYERERLIGKARFMSMNYFNSWSALCNRRTCVILILTSSYVGFARWRPRASMTHIFRGWVLWAF